MSLTDHRIAATVKARTGISLHLHEWDVIKHVEFKDDTVVVVLQTYQVKVLVREDRYEKRGVRMLAYKKSPNSSRWYVDFDETAWDDDFEPFVYEKIGRRKTAQELIEQREFEKLCHRPGTKRTPLDNFQRVWNDPSTPKMERYW